MKNLLILLCLHFFTAPSSMCAETQDEIIFNEILGKQIQINDNLRALSEITDRVKRGTLQSLYQEEEIKGLLEKAQVEVDPNPELSQEIRHRMDRRLQITMKAKEEASEYPKIIDDNIYLRLDLAILVSYCLKYCSDRTKKILNFDRLLYNAQTDTSIGYYGLPKPVDPATAAITPGF